MKLGIQIFFSFLLAALPLAAADKPNIIVILADDMGYSDLGCYGSDTPFRKFKGHTREGGTASPLIAHWPAGISSRDELRQPVGHVIDLMPTLVEISGASYPESVGGKDIKPMEGVSLVPAFKSDSEMLERNLFWEHYGNQRSRSETSGTHCRTQSLLASMGRALR
ncbi:MAG: sulfatase-like hydrolase/transferase, partial [Akkermansiaceae bacterium]|nr:sulfatase-like hydrolase/transferase [Akkermansiaceae bacterium]